MSIRLIKNTLLFKLRASPVGRMLNMPRRFAHASSTGAKSIVRASIWTFSSREDTNYTYPITMTNMKYLAHTISVASSVSPEVCLRYMEEAREDQKLRDHLVNALTHGPYSNYADSRCDFGRRLGWYALARILRPKIVVETGIDKGFGAVLICAALLRNGVGRYFGTDNNPRAGYLLREPYSSVGTILYGDSVDSLNRLDQTIDLFINDSDHSGDYESREYHAIERKLTSDAFILSDNSHATTRLMDWSDRAGRQFLFWKEEPDRHWYAGGGLGISFRPLNSPAAVTIHRS